MKNDYKIIGGIGLLALIILIGGVLLLSKGESSQSVSQDQIVSENGLHWHPKLGVYIKGKKQEIPANIGIGAVHQPIHTHEDAKNGILHMEMQGVVTRDDTKLVNFFRTWGKEFNSSQIFDKKNGDEGKVKMMVNGKENTEFENYKMHDGDNIEIRYD